MKERQDEFDGSNKAKTPSDPVIICPQCRAEIRLTESLAAPLIESTRHEYEARIAKKDAEVAAREARLREQEQLLVNAKESLEEQLAEKLGIEREKIAAEEAKKAKLILAVELDQKAKELTDLQEVLEERNAKLAEAQKAQAEIIRKEREIQDIKRELDLTVEKRVQEGLTAVHERAKKNAEEALQLKVAEKEQTIASMQKTIEELKRKSEQGSQQLQGEVQELELERLLAERFLGDNIEAVPKGEFGGDVLQRVFSPYNQFCGTILWESKRTKNWSDAWLPKLREDQRAAKAEIAVLVSQVLPKTVDTFDLLDNVWVTHPRAVIPVAMLLRHMLIEVTAARSMADGQQTKMEMVYQYLTGSRFRLRVQAIVEAFSSMKEDLDKEKKAIMRQWAKREEQIERVMQATVGMYGDLQGIAGKTLQEIDGLALVGLDESKQGDKN